MLEYISKRQIWLVGLVLGLILGSIFTTSIFATLKDKKCNKTHLDEWTPARDPKTKCDSSLIESSNFLLDENLRLENYIKELEEDNQRLGSYLAEKEIKN